MKFCFWGDIAAAIKGKTIGGGELQMAQLAKSLAMAGHEVVVIDPFSTESFVTGEGIQVIHVADWNKGLPVIRMLWYRIPALYKLFVKQKADYYYVRMRSYLHLISYFGARKAKGKFLLALASDIDLLSFKDKYRFEYKANFKLFKYFTYWLPNDLVYKFLIARADYIIRQHKGQLVKNSAIRGKLLTFPNIVDLQNLPIIDKPSKSYYIYVGSLTIMKGADKLYEIIKSSDKTNIIMVVGQPNDNASVPIFEQIRILENADVKGRINHHDTLQLMANAKALINTSENEGFPNVFLEAWPMGVPVLSLKVNPGNIFAEYELGVCFNNDLIKMKDYINRNDVNKVNTKKMLSYVKEFHDFDTAAERFVRILNNAQ
jgi:glycosyltransferase involved in cell wall biosynthesis